MHTLLRPVVAVAASGMIVAAAALPLAHVAPVAAQPALPPSGTITSSAEPAPRSCPAPTDPDSPITVHKGEQFTVALASNPSTGNLWDFEQPVDKILVNIMVAFDPTDPDDASQGGTQCWTFRTTGAGDTTIRLRYGSPWGDAPAAAQMAGFIVSVVP